MINRIYSKIVWKYYAVIPFFTKKLKVGLSEGKSFSIDVKNAHEVHRVKTFYSKEPEMIEWIDKFYSAYKGDDFVFYDIGANIGIYSLYAATKYRKAFIYSFEPESTNFASLCVNISNNKLSNILAFHIALTNSEEYNFLHVGIVESGAGAAAVGEDYKFIRSDFFLHQGIYCSSLNDIFKNNLFKKPNFIKIDVDGNEAKIIQGAALIFSDPNFIGLIIEFEYNSELEVSTLFEKMKFYNLQHVYTSQWVGHDLKGKSSIRNFIFEKKYNTYSIG